MQLFSNKTGQLILSFIFGLSGLIFAQGTDQPITSNIYFDGEPFLIAHPQEPEKLTVVWMGFNLPDGFRITIRCRTSTDGGNTWSAPISLPHLFPGWGSADPSMDYGPDGTLYLAYIDYRKSPDSGQVIIVRSTNAGVTWSQPSTVMDMTEDLPKRPIDRPWLVADKTNSSHSGNLYITSKPAPWIPMPNRAYHKRSTDGGLSWSGLRYVDTTNYLIGNFIQQPMSVPYIYADGVFGILYPSYMSSQNVYPLFYQMRSTDGGLSFTYNDAILNPTSVQDTNYKLGYHAAAHPTDPDKLAFIGVSNKDGDPDIVVFLTQDKGQTWSQPVRVNQDTPANGKAQDMPWCAWNENGALSVVWRDRRNDAGSGFFTSSAIYGAVSTDGGMNFTNDFQMSAVQAPFDSILIESGNDFLCNIFQGDTISAVWGDVRTGKLNIYFSKKAVNGGVSAVTLLAEESLPNIHIYPNPVKDVCRFEFDAIFTGQKWTLTDIQGKVIQSGVIRELNPEQNLNMLEAGTYFLETRFGSLKAKVKVVKIH